MSLNYKIINKLFDKLFPILRSITGDGYIKSLNILSRYIKFKKLKYPSGKKIFLQTNFHPYTTRFLTPSQGTPFAPAFFLLTNRPNIWFRF